MKIIFMGTPGFAVPSLKILLENKFDVDAVVTVPDKKKGRGLNVSVSEVKKFALENNLKILQPDNLRSEVFVNELKSINPDLIIIVAFRILPKEIFSLPKSGLFNLHASLLPKYRGAAPINWAIIKGETETGVTTFFLKEKVDTGNIIIQEKVNIEEDDNAGTMQNKLADLGAKVVLQTVRHIEQGNVSVAVQDESLASPAPKIFKKDCLIKWNQESTKIHNFIRGLSPYPAAFTFLNNKIIKIFKSGLTNENSIAEPGSILIKDKKLFAATLDFDLEIMILQLEGKKKISAIDFINGIDRSKEWKFSDN